MTTDRFEPVPIACTLQSGDFQERVNWIADLNRDALRSHRREGLRLELTYTRAALDRVREMVAREQDCCAFLKFHLQSEAGSVRLVIEAPEHAGDMLDAVFEPFLAGEATANYCGCSTSPHDSGARE